MNQGQNRSVRTQVGCVTVHFRPGRSLGHVVAQSMALVERLCPFSGGWHGEY